MVQNCRSLTALAAAQDTQDLRYAQPPGLARIKPHSSLEIGNRPRIIPQARVDTPTVIERLELLGLAIQHG